MIRDVVVIEVSVFKFFIYKGKEDRLLFILEVLLGYL